MAVSAAHKLINSICKKVFPFFPTLVVLSTLYFLTKFVLTGLGWFLVLGFLSPYLIPLLTYRLMALFAPIKEGASYIGEEKFSPWVTAFRIQQIYVMFPFLENFLHLLPGLFALWLRLWGSKIGKRVVFAPNISLVDRTHLEIDDYVMFGNSCFLSCHLVEVRKGRFFCYVKKIKIGKGAFIGAFCNLGPGTKIESGTNIPIGSYFTVNQTKPKSIMSS